MYYYYVVGMEDLSDSYGRLVYYLLRMVIFHLKFPDVMGC